MSDRKLEDTPAIGLTVNHAVAENRSIVAQTFVPFDCAQAELDAALDKIFKASERQVARVRLPQAKADLDRLQRAYERASEDLERLDAEHNASQALYAKQAIERGRRDPVKGAQALAFEARNKADRDNTVTSLKRGRQDIDRLTEEIAELESKIAGEPPC